MEATWNGRCKNRMRNKAKEGMVGKVVGGHCDRSWELVQSRMQAPPPPGLPSDGDCHSIAARGFAAWIYRQWNINRQMITEAMTPVRSAIKPVATACRVRRMATEPKYTAST